MDATATPLPDGPEAAEEFAARWIGKELDGRYRIVELLAEGGMGAVFVADHLTLPKQVAIKMIRDDYLTNKTAAARFTREALATARIEHPHVVSAIDYGHLPGGGTYLVMQLVRGETLSQRLEGGALPWERVCLLGSQIADGLAAAHAIKIVHRDLKPDNILLERREDGSLHARVVDFGVAQMSGAALSGPIAMTRKPLTRVGAAIGTPGYMAPEQTVGAEVDFRADLYALGVILWECCAGRFLWDAQTITELRTFQFTSPAQSLAEACRGKVPAALVAVVDRLLERRATDRPASAASVRDDLRRLALRGELGGEAGRPTMIGETSGSGSVSAAAIAQAGASGSAATHAGGISPVWFVVVMVALALVFAVLYALG
jgi:serine/threonine protein kinase